MSTYTGVTNFQKTVRFFWPTLYMLPELLFHLSQIKIFVLYWCLQVQVQELSYYAISWIKTRLINHLAADLTKFITLKPEVVISQPNCLVARVTRFWFLHSGTLIQQGPEGHSLRAESRGEVFGEGSQPPPHQLEGLEERCKLPQRGPGWSPGRPTIFLYFECSLDRFS